MDIKKLKIGDEVSLPGIYFKPKKTSCGFIYYCLFSERKATIIGIEKTKVGRWHERIFTFDDGGRILISRIKHQNVPKDIDGSVYVTNKKRGWNYHPQLDLYLTACKNASDKIKYTEEIFDSWDNQIKYVRETVNESGVITQRGFRPPQIGALHSIGAHWSIGEKPATIVMPTGTGKTETMLAGMVSFIRSRMLIVVPSVPLRDQTSDKFQRLGLLRKLELLNAGVMNPIVGVITKRIKRKKDLDYFKCCNVVISNIENVAQGTATEFGSDIAKMFGYLVIDEAHHIKAKTWNEFKAHFNQRRILQLTATPFRLDKKLVDGKVIFNYPLGMAQKDGYFKEIEFCPVVDTNESSSDHSIANKAVDILKHDLKNNCDHLMMARCSTISRAKSIYDIYKNIAKEYNPVIITSKTNKTERGRYISYLKNRKSRILVCVDMFGEGFDLPSLKIASIHDPHKSLAITLQFTGRFTRAAENVGTAKVIANVANTSFMDSLDNLYIEDADWNQLLSEFSSEAINSHIELIEFLNKCQLIDVGHEDIKAPISPNMLQPKFSVVAFNTDKFQPNHFHKAIPNSQLVKWAWITKDKKTLFFVTMQTPKVQWSRSKQIRNREWDFFVLHFDNDNEILYLNSSDTSSVHLELANSVTGQNAKIISGDQVFRLLGNIQRLSFQKVGLKRPGRRNISYSSFSGIDVESAITEAQKNTSTKSDIAGIGYENGKPVSVGCSKKGRIWTKEKGSIHGLVKWCHMAGNKLLDSSINTNVIIENTMIPKPVEELPDKEILKVDWPLEILNKSEINVKIVHAEQYDLSRYELNYVDCNRMDNSIRFKINSDEHTSVYIFKIGGDNLYSIKHQSGPQLTIEIGSRKRPLEQYLYDYPPSILFIDGSELDGSLLFELKSRKEIDFPPQQVEAWNWDGIDITKESKWKDDVERNDSIQAKVIDTYLQNDYDIVFNDDGAGEAADVVCLKENINDITVLLLHCKYSGGSEPGARVKDVVEVCAQAVKSNKWIWRFSRLCEHLSRRESVSKESNKRSRFEMGNSHKLNKLKRASRFKHIKAQIIIVQPGIQKSNISNQQANILSSAHSYLLETVNIPLSVISS